MRRAKVWGLAAVALALGAVGPATPGATAVQAGPLGSGSCPPAVHLVGRGTHWNHRRLAPGVTLARTRVMGGRGLIDVDVVRADLRRRSVRVAPLRHALPTLHRLTALSKHRHLVASTNGPYFNVSSGGPKVPVITGRHAVVLSTTPEPVAGIGVDRRAEDGDVWLTGGVRDGRASYPLSGLNVAWPVSGGLTVYGPAWGRHRVPLPSGARSRAVRRGRLVTRAGRRDVPPPGGDLLVARGSRAVDWLRSLPGRSRVRVRSRLHTDAPRRFAQAYGVGTQTVARRGHLLTGLYCADGERYAARTSIAWTHHGHTLMLVTVESPRGSDFYGVDENQMSGLLVALGAERAFALDGGASTELVARLRVHIRRRHHHHVHVIVRKRLVLAVHPPRSPGRAIPLGIGIYSQPRHHH
jgi:hypothetical protein